MPKRKQCLQGACPGPVGSQGFEPTCFDCDVLEIQDFLVLISSFNQISQQVSEQVPLALLIFTRRCRQDMKMKTMAILTVTWYHVMKVRFPPSMGLN